MAYAWLLTQSMKLHTISIPHIKRTSAVIDPTDLIFFFMNFTFLHIMSMIFQFNSFENSFRK